MRAIEAIGTVQDDGMLLVPVPSDIEPGRHRVVVVIDQLATMPKRRPTLRLGRYNVALVDPTMTFRREDIYDDSGR